MFLDWTTDIVDPSHLAFMLAPPDAFREAMERSGIADGSTVVAYSDRLGSGPHRLWWASRMYGHDQVRVLDGGWEKWMAEGRPITTELPDPAAPATWTPSSRLGAPVASSENVLHAGEDGRSVVLDSRPPEQFRGESVWFETGPVSAEPDGIARTPRGDLRAGRIPWAINIPAAELYRDDHTMKSPEELRDVFARAGIDSASRAITYCGVGISASALAFALVRAGFEEVALYDGSRDEWARDPSKPVVRGP